MLYRTLKRMIVCGQPEGIVPKSAFFSASDKLIPIEFQELLGFLRPNA